MKDLTEDETSFTEKGIRFTFLPESRHFKCGSCSKVLKTRFTAKIHTYSHTKEKPFKCPNCPMSFSHRSTLVNHKKIHKKPEFQCPQCLAWFVRKANLKRHLRVVHKSSEENINKSIPKAKPGPRRKIPSMSRDLSFVKIRDISTPVNPPYRDPGRHTQQQRMKVAPPRVHLLPPVSFAEDPVVTQALPIPNNYVVHQAQKMRQRPKRKLAQADWGREMRPPQIVPAPPRQSIYRGDPVKLCPPPVASRQAPLEFQDFNNTVPNFEHSQISLPPPIILPNNNPFETIPPQIPIMPTSVETTEGIKDAQDLQLPLHLQFRNPRIVRRQPNEVTDEDLFMPWLD